MQSEDMKLLTVGQTFLIEGRGVMVLPLIPEYHGPMSFPVVLRKPGGEEAIAQAQLDIPREHPPPEHFSYACSLSGVGKQDVPIGTEIWIRKAKPA
jgi:hypothetical protein